MSSKIIVSNEMLARAFIETSKDFHIKSNLNNKGIFAPQEFSHSLITATQKELLTDDKHLVLLSGYNTPSPALKTGLEAAVGDAQTKLDDLKKWFLGEFRNVDDKLEKLAQKIDETVKNSEISAKKFLKRMQPYVFKWVLRNSVVDSFEVGSNENTINFVPSKVPTKGKFEFGRVDKDLSSVAGILTVLNLIPNISVEVDVDYDK